MELQRAYDTLMDEQKRAQYDRWLEGGSIIPFDTWMSLQSTHSVRILYWLSVPISTALLMPLISSMVKIHYFFHKVVSGRQRLHDIKAVGISQFYFTKSLKFVKFVP